MKKPAQPPFIIGGALGILLGIAALLFLPACSLIPEASDTPDDTAIEVPVDAEGKVDWDAWGEEAGRIWREAHPTPTPDPEWNPHREVSREEFERLLDITAP